MVMGTSITQSQRSIVLLAEQRTGSQLVVGRHHVSVRTPTWVIRHRGAAERRLREKKYINVKLKLGSPRMHHIPVQSLGHKAVQAVVLVVQTQ